MELCPECEEHAMRRRFLSYIPCDTCNSEGLLENEMVWMELSSNMKHYICRECHRKIKVADISTYVCHVCGKKLTRKRQLPKSQKVFCGMCARCISNESVYFYVEDAPICALCSDNVFHMINPQ